MVAPPEILNFLLLPILLLFLLSPTHGIDLSLRTRIPDDIDDHWKFPQDVPYHYFNSIRDIPQSLLPIDLSHLPEANGVWVITFEEFERHSKSVLGVSIWAKRSRIYFDTKSLAFKSVSIKALAFGAVELNVILRSEKVFQETIVDKEKVSLFVESNSNCTSHKEEVDEELKWIDYEVHSNRSHHHMVIDVAIHQVQSFFILDEILIHFDEPPSLADKEEGDIKRLSCKIDD